MKEFDPTYCPQELMWYNLAQSSSICGIPDVWTPAVVIEAWRIGVTIGVTAHYN